MHIFTEIQPRWWDNIDHIPNYCTETTEVVSDGSDKVDDHRETKDHSLKIGRFSQFTHHTTHSSQSSHN